MSSACASAEDVTRWIGGARQGDADAFRHLYERYFPQLVTLAQRWFRGRAPRVADGEDVAQSALHSFYRAASAGRFTDLHDRDDLWSLLGRITFHKAANLARGQRARKRGGGEVRGESAFAAADDSDRGGLDAVPSTEPPPEVHAEMNEAVAGLLGALGGELLEVARLKLEGYTHLEIAARLGVCEETVGRRLRYIRRIWQKRGGRE
jgi:RNA polymerase sigma factor (sigma-70 family)